MKGRGSVGCPLIISHANDLHAQHVVEVAARRGIDAHLWDISEYPNRARITLEPSPDGPATAIHLGPDSAPISVSGIWWRRPNPPAERTGQEKRDYIRSESEVVIRSLADFLPGVNWISEPEATRLACRKPVQLALAQAIGFRVPDTCVSNDPGDAARFVSRIADTGRQLTMKPVGSAFMALSDRGPSDPEGNYVVFTKVVEPKTILDNLHMVPNCPVIFQEVISKDFDVRVTVVDNHVFAARVELHGHTDPTNLDWRHHAGERLYSPHAMPAEVQNLCVALVERLGLRFGCIDLAYSEREGYSFFEVNPQGQWLPSELRLGYPIAATLLDALVAERPSRPSPRR